MIAMFSRFDTGTWVMVVLAVIIGIYLLILERREKGGKGNDLIKRYATMTEEILAAIPDEELVRAVAANLLNKQDEKHPDLSVTLPLLSFGRCGIYSVWLVCNELEKRDLAAYFRSPYRRFAGYAAEGFETIGATACAAAMTAACEAYEKKETARFTSLTDELRQAIKTEQPLSLCVTYIRDNPHEFVDSKGDVE